MLAVPLHRVLRMHPIGGGPGQRILAAYTHRDLAAWSELVVRCLACCGVARGDVIQNACPYELFTDGPGLHYAGECLGATVVPIAGGAARQLAVMKDFGVSILCSTPSFLVYLLERAEKTGVDVRGLPLRAGVLVGEPFSEAMRRRIEESAGIKAYDVYGLPEAIGPGMAVECRHQSGLHVFEDHFYPEIVDPVSGAPRADGEEGELVLTTLSKEAMPLVRYRTGDLTAMVPEPCPCGRTLRRIRRIDRRAQEMFVIQGVTVYPSQIEAALLAVEGAMPPYQLVLTQEGGLDQLEVQIEVTSRILSDRVGAMESLQSRLAEEIEKGLGISVPVRLVEPHAIERSQGKGRRVVDRRGASS
jgi:phenylacetate-CoA ligase